MEKARKFEVDSDLLRYELHKRGYGLANASKKMGFSASYLQVMMSQGATLPARTLKLLNTTFGIRPEVIGRGYDPNAPKSDLEPCATTVPYVDFTKPFKAPDTPASAKQTAETPDVQIEVLRLVYNTLTVFAMELNRIIDKANGDR